MDKLRQEFEAEFLKQSPKSKRDIFKKNDDGEYFYLMPRVGWRFWKAARESLTIELPTGCNPSIVADVKQEKYLIGINDGIERCRLKLIDDGVNVR